MPSVNKQSLGKNSTMKAQWIMLGLTTGRGHNSTTNKKTQPVKQVLGYPLVKNFRQLLSEVSA
jgi:hypothetical protein